MTTDLSWSIFQAWNKAIENREERGISARNRIWASELGGAYIDRYLKMTGVEPSNPFDSRALRKFEAGNMMEWVVGLVLKRAGIFIDAQEWVEYQYPNLLSVSGKLDFLAGVKPDCEKAKTEISDLGLPAVFGSATSAIIDYLRGKFPDGMKTIVLETKSCSNYMFEKYLKTGADERHKMQAFHYLMAKDLDEAHVVYISKDDLRMLEFGVFKTPEVEAVYKKDIETMSDFYYKKIQPPKEKEIIVDDKTGNFTANFKVGYSNYLKMLYGHENQGDFDDKFRAKVSKWNRVLKRVKEEKKMTELNTDTLNEIKAEGFDIGTPKQEAL